VTSSLARWTESVLDMLAPWECIDAGRGRRFGTWGSSVLLRRHDDAAVVDWSRRVREHGRIHRAGVAAETLVRTWHVEGLAVRPDHRMIGHTGFLVTSQAARPRCDCTRRGDRRPATG
jgi:tRNA (adenine57-N1/adenine58-N1)-methyltransferase catalytic subunit